MLQCINVLGAHRRLTCSLIFNHLMQLVLVFEVNKLSGVKEQLADVVARFS
jgi:hypothetical protein